MPHSTEWLQNTIDSDKDSPLFDDDNHLQQPSTERTLNTNNIHTIGQCSCIADDTSPLGQYRRRQSQQSNLAKIAMATANEKHANEVKRLSSEGITDDVDRLRSQLDQTLSSIQNGVTQPRLDPISADKTLRPAPSRGVSMAAALQGRLPEGTGATMALNDTPAASVPNSPRMYGDVPQPPPPSQLLLRDSMMANVLGSNPIRQGSGSSTPRIRPTTLDIPGLTKSKVSPDGRIAQRDLGSKLVIVMVGLPARGKSYITKKLARYLNWLQHDTKIFNVGERRRLAAGGAHPVEKSRSQEEHSKIPSIPLLPSGVVDLAALSEAMRKQPVSAAQILLNGHTKLEPPATPPRSAVEPNPPSTLHPLSQHLERNDSEEKLASPNPDERVTSADEQKEEQHEAMDQSASFFDPANKKASHIREQVAMETLDELLDFILNQNGSVGILDATNSTPERRKTILMHIRERAGPELNILFLESQCLDQDLLEANMRLKLNGPDYRDMDPSVALEDFKKRVKVYETAYVPLGDYEDGQNIPYIKMIDVGRKVISHQIRGFLSAQANYYLLNFNLAPRQIWITRHGLSVDNVSGKIGGDSDLAPEGIIYARALTRFMDEKRQEWEEKQIEALKNTHFPPLPGDATPPNPHYSPQSPKPSMGPSLQPTPAPTPNGASSTTPATEDELPPGYEPKGFCVWTSMLKRSVQTAQFFNDEVYDTKQMRMLDELNAGVMEGLTYSCISTQFPDEYRARKADKLHYRYPGPGGEGYLDIINRLRPVIVELERMTDHVLLVGHRSVARVLLAYFRGLNREEVADLDVPLGMLYCLEPKPYGVDFKAYQWDRQTEWFNEVPNFQLRPAEDDML